MEWSNFLHSLSELPFDPHVHFVATALSLACKLFLFFFLLRTSFKTQKGSFLSLLLSLFLLGTIFENIICILAIAIREIGKAREIVPLFAFLARIQWALVVPRCQLLAAFLLLLTQKNVSLSFWHIIHSMVSIIFGSIFLYLAFFTFNEPSWGKYMRFEVKCEEIATIYGLLLFIATFYKIYQNSRNQKMPIILLSQVNHLKMFVVTYLFFSVLETATSPTSFLNSLIDLYKQPKVRYSIYALKEVFTTYAAYFAIKKIMGLRFLNNRNTIKSKEPVNFLEQFHDIIEQLNASENIRETMYPVQSFFSTAFAIPLKQTHLFIRKNNGPEKTVHLATDPELFSKVEHYLAQQNNTAFIASLSATKICMREDIHFTQFYEDDDTKSTEMLIFLDTIEADIFLPIFERNSLIAYIIIKKDSKDYKLFTNKERDEMLLFTTYLSNIINFLSQNPIEALHIKAKHLSDSLYEKHQENNQLRECLRSYMQSNGDQKIGVVFYRRKFTFANVSAEEIIGMDLNKNNGHPLTEAFKSVAHLVQHYKSSQSKFAYDGAHRRVVITGLLAQDGFSVILYVYYPEISEVVKTKLNKIKDPSDWDYVLYLETTQSGKLVNKMIPGSTETIINFKVQLLKASLSKRATLLDLPEKDLLPSVEILHSISLRETLHTLKLENAESNHEIAITLFGISPLIEKDRQALLKKLDLKGSLFIQNIEFLDLETQNLLAQFLVRGFFHHYKSDHRVFSSVRVICSSQKNLHLLMTEGKFSPLLFQELQPTALIMPPLHKFPEEEINELAQELAEQITLSEKHKTPSTLTTNDNQQLISEHPLSLCELQQKVRLLLTKKISEQGIHAASDGDPLPADNIQTAVRLGKKALKDPQVMKALWNHFKNKNNIATMLGVSVSSVSRCCQKFNLN